MSKPGFSVGDLILFVQVFRLDFVSAATGYVRCILSSLEPVCRDDAFVEPDNFASATGEAGGAIDALADRIDSESLVNLLLEILEETNPYNYEVIRYLLATLEVRN